MYLTIQQPRGHLEKGELYNNPPILNNSGSGVSFLPANCNGKKLLRKPPYYEKARDFFLFDYWYFFDC